MPRALFVLVLLSGLLAGAAARAGELIMFEQAYCDWCEAWDEEVGRIYDRTDEGRLLPLRRVDIHEKRPADLAVIGRVRFTPTFVVMDGGREIGLHTSYQASVFGERPAGFWLTKFFLEIAIFYVPGHSIQHPYFRK